MERMIVEVKYCHDNIPVTIVATMKYNTLRKSWECDQVHSVYWDCIFFDLDDNHDHMARIENLIGDVFDAVEEMFREEDYTELIEGHDYNPMAYVGHRKEDFLWSSN